MKNKHIKENILYRIARRLYHQMRNREEHNFLKDIFGLVHVGANFGQECHLYDEYGLNVIWIEPIPHIYDQLRDNIKKYKKQRAFNELITNKDNKEYKFHIANNNGCSSSIYPFKEHKDIWPSIICEKMISIVSTTLTSLYKKESINSSLYQALVMDTQGSELLVLKGCIPILQYFKYIKTEVADFESYEEGCTLLEIENFMFEHGYEELARNKFAESSKGGSYYDITYKKVTDNNV